VRDIECIVAVAVDLDQIFMCGLRHHIGGSRPEEGGGGVAPFPLYVSYIYIYIYIYMYMI